jgi:hypothetical protein
MELIEGETVEAYVRRNRLIPPYLALELPSSGPRPHRGRGARAGASGSQAEQFDDHP